MDSCETSAAPPWRIHCDGSAFPNPGRMGLGAIMIAPDGARYTLSQACEARGCNNEAELRALMAAVQAVRVQGAQALQVFSDNSIVIEQLGVSGVPPIVRLASLFDEARALLSAFERVTLQWIPRHRNGEADALARAALGMAPKPQGSQSRRRR